jgi:dTDP-4-amino-4,6-dideoxygalactose transaminase
MVALNDLERHFAPHLAELETAARRVLKSGRFILGPDVVAFERAFAAYCGTAHCVAVGNGTDALELALRALGIGPGSRVATVANAGMYATTAIVAAGAEPCLVDIAGDTLLVDVDALSRAIAHVRPAAVVVTHLYGRMAAMPRIVTLCRDAGVAVVEDCAQAHGATLAGAKAGSFGDVGCFSFYPTKNLGALGDGGAVVTGREDLARRLTALRQYGWSGKYVSEIAGGRNSRLDELQAALLSTLLPRLDAWNARRRAIAQTYSTRIAHPRVRCPDPAAARAGSDVAHLYVVQTPDRSGLAAHLRQAGIDTAVHYPVPDHRQPALRGRFADTTLPGCERACAEVLTLPCFPEMTAAEIDAVVVAVNCW